MTSLALVDYVMILEYFFEDGDELGLADLAELLGAQGLRSECLQSGLSTQLRLVGFCGDLGGCGTIDRFKCFE